MMKLPERRTLWWSIAGALAVITAAATMLDTPPRETPTESANSLSAQVTDSGTPDNDPAIELTNVPTNPFGPAPVAPASEAAASLDSATATPNGAATGINTSIEKGLYSSSAEERAQALDLMLQSPDQFYNQPEIVNRIEELTMDRDPEIAEFANDVLIHFTELQAEADDAAQQSLEESSASLGLEEPLIEEPVPEFTAEETVDEAASGTETNFVADSEGGIFAELSERALRDPDPSQRRQAIEEAVIQRDEQTVVLLSQAAQDTDGDNRLAVIEGLRQLWSEGVGDAQEINALLQQSAMDPDSRVAEAAQQAIEQLNTDTSSN